MPRYPLARLELLNSDELYWSPHPEANSAGVTIWHVARFLDLRATRAFTARPASADIWHTYGWRDRAGYEPDGLGWQGLGLLTGYAPAQMRAVTALGADELASCLWQGCDQLVEQINQLRENIHHIERNRLQVPGRRPLTPYQTIASPLQGSSGHVEEHEAPAAIEASGQHDGRGTHHRGVAAGE